MVAFNVDTESISAGVNVLMLLCFKAYPCNLKEKVWLLHFHINRNEF